jgi:hypothetical protein
LALAGGGAMIVHGFVSRATKDIDLFTEIDDTEAGLSRDTSVLLAYLLIGTGFGFANAPITNTAVSGLPPARHPPRRITAHDARFARIRVRSTTPNRADPLIQAYSRRTRTGKTPRPRGWPTGVLMLLESGALQGADAVVTMCYSTEGRQTGE